MLALKATATEPNPTPIARAADALKTAVAGVRKPNALRAAEECLTEAQQRRVIAVDAQRAAIHTHRQNQSSGAERAVKAATTEIEKVDAELRKHHAALNERRAAFAPTLAHLLQDPLADLEQELVALCEDFEAAVTGLAEVDRFCRRGALQPPPFARRYDRLAGVVRDLRHVLTSRRP